MGITFDEEPVTIGIHNRVDRYWWYGRPGLSLSAYVPPGVYDVIVVYEGVTTKVVKENIAVNTRTNLTIRRSDASHEVRLRLLTVDSHEIHMPLDHIGYSALQHKQSGATIAFLGAFTFQVDPHRLYFSDLSSAYRYEARLPDQSEGSHWDFYDFFYQLTDGITTSLTLQNDPSQFKHVEYHFKPDPFTMQLKRRWWWSTDWLDTTTVPPAEHTYGAPFKEEAYYVPQPADAVWKWSFAEVYDGNSNLLYTTPRLHVRDQSTIDMYLPGLSAEPVFSTTATYLPVGSAPPHWHGKFENQDYAIIPNEPQVREGLLVLNQALDRTNYGSLTYELYQSGQQIDSGIITRLPISLRTPGAYTMTVPYTHYYVRGRPGSARATIGFDTSHPTDKNPPYLLSLNVMVGDRMVESLTPSDVGEIRFAAGDDTGLGQVTLAYQAGGAWQELPLHQSGNVFTATVPMALSDSYVALRITAWDTQGNWLAYEVNPAFYVLTPPIAVTISGPTMGVVGKECAFTANTSPVAAAQPITYVWQATGQSPVTHTNGSNDVVNFIWSAVGAQFITVTAANEIGAVTGTYALSILTQTQAISHNVELVSQTGGPLNAVAVQGNYAYVGIGPSMDILDISNPGRPAVVGHMGLLPDVVYRIAVSGKYAYVANGYGGLRIVDISNPASPREIGFYHAEDFDAWGGVTVAGNYAYVAGASGLYIINISNPANPQLVGFFSTPEAARNVVLSGTYAYVAAGNHGLYVVNVSDPAYPQEVAIYLEAAHDVAIAGSYAYVADDVVGFRIINISNPSQHYQVGSYPMTNLHYVSVANDYAYVVNDQYLNVIRVSDPAHPAWISKFYIADVGPPHGTYDPFVYTGRGIQVANGHAYVVNGTSLSLINITNPATPCRVGFYDTPAVSPSAVAVAGTLAYVANGWRGLRIFNFQDPAHPARIGAYDSPGASQSVAVVGPFAYLAAGTAGLRILNVLYPTNPTEAGFVDTFGWARGVAVAEGYAYIADGQDGLRIARVQDAAHPTPVGSYDTPGSAQNVVVSGTYAYVADSEGGLCIINVSDRTHPTEVGSVHTAGQAMDVAVEGNYAYVADSWGWLRIVNVSDPAHPTEVSSFGNMAGPVYDVAVMQDYAYIIDDNGLHVIYVSDPAHPAEVGFYELPPFFRYASSWKGSTLAVTAGGYIYFAGEDLGLVILRYRPEPLKAIVMATPTHGTPPLTVKFTNQSTGDYTSALWNFGDGFTSTLASPTHTYSAVGAYTVTMTINGPGDSDTLTRANYIHVYLPQPILVAPMCGTTNNTQPVVRGLAPGGFVITLYDRGAQLLTTTTTLSHTFAMTPSLAAGQHVLTATATNAIGTGLASRPLTLTVSPTLIYDPAGVTFAYAVTRGDLVQHPRDASACANPDGGRIWLRSTYTTTVTVPVSDTTSAAVTLTLGTQTVPLVHGTGQTFTGVLTPPIVGGTVVITVTADGQTVTTTGSALIDPDGVVFKSTWDSHGITQTLAGISVTCEYSNTVADEWVTWNAAAYEQANPQVTGMDGFYSFFVPPGTYRITAWHPDYWPQTSPDTTVVDAPARLNIPLALIRRVYLPMVLRQSP